MYRFLEFYTTRRNPTDCILSLWEAQQTDQVRAQTDLVREQTDQVRKQVMGDTEGGGDRQTQLKSRLVRSGNS